jgi:hypothetical protein
MVVLLYSFDFPMAHPLRHSGLRDLPTTRGNGLQFQRACCYGAASEEGATGRSQERGGGQTKELATRVFLHEFSFLSENDVVCPSEHTNRAERQTIVQSLTLLS